MKFLDCHPRSIYLKITPSEKSPADRFRVRIYVPTYSLIEVSLNGKTVKRVTNYRAVWRFSVGPERSKPVERKKQKSGEE